MSHSKPGSLSLPVFKRRGCADRRQVSSRKVLQAVLDRRKVPVELFGPVCVVVDKIDKIGADKARLARSRAASACAHGSATC